MIKLILIAIGIFIIGIYAGIFWAIEIVAKMPDIRKLRKEFEKISTIADSRFAGCSDHHCDWSIKNKYCESDGCNNYKLRQIYNIATEAINKILALTKAEEE